MNKRTALGWSLAGVLAIARVQAWCRSGGGRALSRRPRLRGAPREADMAGVLGQDGATLRSYSDLI